MATKLRKPARLRRRGANAVRSARPAARPGPEGGARRTNRRQREDQLVRAGLQLFLTQGVEAVTIDAIVRRAKLAKGSFYRYFRDKTDLVRRIVAPLYAAVADALGRCEEATRSSTVARDLVRAYESLALELGFALVAHPQAARLYLQECHGPATGPRAPLRALADLIESKALTLTQVAQERGLLRPLDPCVSSLAVVGATERLARHLLAAGNAPALPAAVAALISLIVEGAGAAR